jgi:hypothetical protein
MVYVAPPGVSIERTSRPPWASKILTALSALPPVATYLPSGETATDQA